MSSITIPNSSATVELNKSEIYELIHQLSRHLARDYGDYSYHLNADTVIAVIRNSWPDNNTAYFLGLHKDTQRSIASDALTEAIGSHTYCSIDEGFEEIAEEVCIVAARSAIEKSRR